MNSTEGRLTELLHQATPEPSVQVDLDAVALRLRRVRRRAGLAVLGSAVAVAVAVAVPLAVRTTGGPASPVAGTGPASAGDATVMYRGVGVVLPPGWREVPQAACAAPLDRTVVAGDQPEQAATCPVRPDQKPVTWLRLTNIYGPGFAVSAAGDSAAAVVWNGQPGRLSTVANRDGSTTTTLDLTWLNVSVRGTATGAAAARSLLDQVRVPPPGSSLAVPDSASSVSIQALTGQDGNRPAPAVTVTDPPSIRQLLADLRALQPQPSAQRACDENWYPNTALVTVATRTFAVRFDACAEVTGGTGGAALASAQLRADITRLLPNSGLPS